MRGLKQRSTHHGQDLASFRLIRRRCLEAHALRQEGLTQREVGERLGVSPQRARQLIAKGQRILDCDYRHVGEACELLIEIATVQRWPKYREDHQGMAELIALEAQARLREALRAGEVLLG